MTKQKSFIEKRGWPQGTGMMIGIGTGLAVGIIMAVFFSFAADNIGIAIAISLPTATGMGLSLGIALERTDKPSSKQKKMTQILVTLGIIIFLPNIIVLLTLIPKKGLVRSL